MAVLQKFSGVRPHPEAFVEALEPLQPRLYSISSSHNATPGKLSLTVDCVRYVIGKRKRLGLASTFLAERINPGDELKVYVQKAHGFALPQDPKTPIIMIGPGTGIAPFRAFLLDRKATGAPGKNWLFFGHQRSDCDFFYADELNAMKTSGLLTRLSLAWSRDGDKKFYVQDRMREVGREVWTWLAEGAHRLHLRRRQADGQGRRARAGRHRRPVRRPLDRRGRQLCRGTQEEGPVPAGRLLRPGSNPAQIGPNKILGPVRRTENFPLGMECRRSVRYRYFGGHLESRRERYSICSSMRRWRSTMRELSAEARLHLYARSLSRRTGAGLHTAALYSAFAVIAAIVFGTLSVHPF